MAKANSVFLFQKKTSNPGREEGFDGAMNLRHLSLAHNSSIGGMKGGAHFECRPSCFFSVLAFGFIFVYTLVSLGPIK